MLPMLPRPPAAVREGPRVERARRGETPDGKARWRMPLCQLPAEPESDAVHPHPTYASPDEGVVIGELGMGLQKCSRRRRRWISVPGRAAPRQTGLASPSRGLHSAMRGQRHAADSVRFAASHAVCIRKTASPVS